MDLLVTYATAHGSTREIAERIAARLGRFASWMDCLPAEHVLGVDGYDAFVIGSAVHDGSWLPAATRLVQDDADEIVGKPVWLFSVGMPAALPTRALRRWTRHEGPLGVAAARQRLGSRGDIHFSGVFRRGTMSRTGAIMFRLAGGRFGDFRDWAQIDAWADRIGVSLVHDRSAETFHDPALPTPRSPGSAVSQPPPRGAPRS